MADAGEAATAGGRRRVASGSPYEPVIDRAGEVAADRGVAGAQIALSWLLHKPGVTAPIVGATRIGHLEDALAAEQLSLSDEEIKRLEEPYVPHPVSGIEV